MQDNPNISLPKVPTGSLNDTRLEMSRFATLHDNHHDDFPDRM